MICLIFSGALFAACEVGGITDSPQQLNCMLGSKNLNLSCRENIYFLGEEKVLFSWHEEVEEGSSPLLFKTATIQLKITKHDRDQVYDAVLEGPVPVTGSCQ